MKRIAAIALVSVYVLLTLGAQLHIHYCCGKLADSGFFADSKKCNDGCSEETSIGHVCCEFVEVSFTLDDDHINSTFKLPINFGDFSGMVESLTPVQSVESTRIGFSPIVHVRKSELPIYLRYQSLVLYA